MRSGGFFWKIFGGTIAVIIITAFIVYLSAVPTIDRGLLRDVEDRVRQEAEITRELCTLSLIEGTNEFDTGSLSRVSQHIPATRFTLVAASGSVIFDSHEDPEKMDDHGTRPEILNLGIPLTRYSRTLDEKMTYMALPIQRDGEVMAFSRIAVSVEDGQQRVDELRGAVRDGALLATLISLLLAWFFARRVTQPISEIAALVTEIGAHHTPRRLAVDSNDELGRLAQAVNHMADELQGQITRVERDRTEREAIFSAMADGILAVNQDQRVLFINRPARQFLGSLEGRLKGKPVWELVRNRKLLDLIQECLETNERCTGESKITVDDNERVLELVAVPMGPADDERHGCVLELRDISDLRRLEAVRQDFVSNVSHELKTPLTAMRGYTETLLEDEDMPESMRRSFLEKAYSNTERLVAIVSDLLSLSRLQSDQHELSFEKLDVREFVKDVLGDLRDLADSMQIRFEVEVDDGSLEVEADIDALSMAFSNLVTNAVRYSPEGERVQVQVLATDHEIRIDVTDHGPGIPEHEQERIFERFYRVDKARSRRLGGTGLGLSIVKNVMATHGGRVELNSSLGHGSCFSLILGRA